MPYRDDDDNEVDGEDEDSPHVCGMGPAERAEHRALTLQRWKHEREIIDDNRKTSYQTDIMEMMFRLGAVVVVCATVAGTAAIIAKGFGHY